MALTVIIPIKTTNPNNGQTGNTRLAAIIRGKQRKSQRAATALCIIAKWIQSPFWRPDMLPAYVTVTRLAPSNGLDPHDGLGAALKGCIDGVADALGLKNDRDPRVKWKLMQERSKTYGVRVEIRPR